MNIPDFLGDFEARLATAESPRTRVRIIVESLTGMFEVKEDEIALFTLDSSRDMLVFVWPESLKGIGSIPLTAHRCVVTRTALENSSFLDNSFSSTPHLQMFEHFLLDKEKRVPIQKIMSSPLHDGETLKGVIQIARKGPDRDAAGADFKSSDTELLTRVAAIIARYF